MHRFVHMLTEKMWTNGEKLASLEQFMQLPFDRDSYYQSTEPDFIKMISMDQDVDTDLILAHSRIAETIQPWTCCTAGTALEILHFNHI